MTNIDNLRFAACLPIINRIMKHYPLELGGVVYDGVLFCPEGEQARVLFSTQEDAPSLSEILASAKSILYPWVIYVGTMEGLDVRMTTSNSDGLCGFYDPSGHAVSHGPVWHAALTVLEKIDDEKMAKVIQEQVSAQEQTSTKGGVPYKTLRRLQDEVGEWSRENFGDQPSYRPLLGAVEEVGELAHAHLKREQGIRTNEDHRRKQLDAIGDIVIYLADYCSREGICLRAAIQDTWRLVAQRNWKKDPEKAGIESLDNHNKDAGDTMAGSLVGKKGTVWLTVHSSYDPRPIRRRQQFVVLSDLGDGYIEVKMDRFWMGKGDGPPDIRKLHVDQVEWS